MAYQTGNSNTIGELLEKLAEFTKLLEWKINKITPSSLYVSNSSGYWALEFKNNSLFTIPASGFDNNRDCFNQPGSACNHSADSVKTRTSHLDKGQFISYDFFGTSQYIHVVIQYESEKFRHFGFGTLNKEGEYEGGQYSFGTYINDSTYYRKSLGSSENTFGFSYGKNQYGPVVRADGIGGDASSPWYFQASNPYKYSDVSNNNKGSYMLTVGRISSYRHHPSEILLENSQSKFGQVIIPVPNSPIAQCKDGLFRRLGTLPDRYQCRLVGIAPRQILEVNNERWMFIPSAQYQHGNPSNSSNSNDENSGEYGVAYRLVE